MPVRDLVAVIGHVGRMSWFQICEGQTPICKILGQISSDQWDESSDDHVQQSRSAAKQQLDRELDGGNLSAMGTF